MQLKKEQIMKNVEKFYQKYYDAYKSDYDANDELNETKKKNLTTQSLNWLIKPVKNQN